MGEIYDEKEVEIFERTGFIKEVAPDVYNVDYRSTVQELGGTIGVVGTRGLHSSTTRLNVSTFVRYVGYPHYIDGSSLVTN